MVSRTWWYVNQYLDSQKKAKEIWQNKLTNYGAFAKSALFRAVLKDQEENVHSLIDRNTCSCGLRLKDPTEILFSEHHRNHTTLTPEPEPWFRGRVGNRLQVFTKREHPVDKLWNELIEPYRDQNYGYQQEPFKMDRTPTYTDKYVDPQKTIDRINKEFGIPTSSPVAYGKWAKLSIFKVALKDVEENLHSLLEERTCSCGLKVKEPSDVLTSPYHRNHTTLKPEPNPKFRGKVGKRITMPLTGLDWQHKVDQIWDELVETPYNHR